MIHNVPFMMIMVMKMAHGVPFMMIMNMKIVKGVPFIMIMIMKMVAPHGAWCLFHDEHDDHDHEDGAWCPFCASFFPELWPNTA